MKKIINALIIALALAFVLPVGVKAQETGTEEIQCMCKGGEKCCHRLPTRTFKNFEEWEKYYFDHREIGVYWDSYLYKTYAFRYDKDRNILWKPTFCYPFEDIETWLYWFDTCWEKQAKGEYKYEWPYGKPRK